MLCHAMLCYVGATCARSPFGNDCRPCCLACTHVPAFYPTCIMPSLRWVQGQLVVGVVLAVARGFLQSTCVCVLQVPHTHMRVHMPQPFTGHHRLSDVGRYEQPGQGAGCMHAVWWAAHCRMRQWIVWVLSAAVGPNAHSTFFCVPLMYDAIPLVAVLSVLIACMVPTLLDACLLVCLPVVNGGAL